MEFADSHLKAKPMNKAQIAYDCLAPLFAAIDKTAEHGEQEPFPELLAEIKALGLPFFEDILAGGYGYIVEWWELKNSHMGIRVDYMLEPAFKSGDRCHHNLTLTLTEKRQVKEQIILENLIGPVIIWEEAEAA